jgi:tetratricopeptide (TPR) repeat protein
VPGLPDELRDQILVRAEGVPLYAVETVRMLLDRGALVQEGSVYRPAGEIGPLEVPETLHALIAARLDGLSEEERRLLQDGAVLGKTFTREGLAALSRSSGEELDSLLSSLVRKEVLSRQSDPRSPEHGQYGFLQDLVRHVAYETLSRRDRRIRHLAVAAYLEAAFQDEDEFVEVLASHYVEAYGAAVEAEDAGEVKTKARDTLVRAGERADSLGAAGEAQRYLERASELADGPAGRAALLDRAGWHARDAGDLDDAERLLGESVALYESVRDTHAAARVAGRLAAIEWRHGRQAEAMGRAERAFEVVAGDEPDEDTASLAAGLAAGYAFAGDQERAHGLAELALEVAESLGSAEILTRVMSTKALIAIGRGRPQEANAFLKHGLTIALENELWDQAHSLYFNLSDHAFHRDRYEEALPYLREALALARRRGSRPAEWSVLAEITYPLYMTGRWEEARSSFAELPEAGQPFGLTLSLLDSILQIHLHRGELDEARALLSSFSALEQATDIQDRSAYLSAKATMLRAEGRPAEALPLGVEAADLSREAFGIGSQASKHGLVQALEAALTIGDRERARELLATIDSVPPGLRPPYLEAQAHRFRARLAESDEAAESDFEAPTGRFRELGIVFWLGVTLLEHAEWLIGQRREDEAAPLLAEAREILERLEATPWLERLEKVGGEAKVPA